MDSCFLEIMETMETKQVINAIHHLIIAMAYQSDNYQRMMKGEVPLNGKKEFFEIVNDMMKRNQEIIFGD